MEQAKKEETEKKGGLTRMARRLAGVDELSRGRSAISELFSAIDPRKYAPSRAAEWANPPKSEVRFETLMKRNGITERDLAKRHRVHALTVYLVLFLCTGLVTSGIVSAVGGSAFTGLAAAFTGLALGAAMGFKHSLATMQIRDRSLNTGWREWSARRGEWFPPVDAA